MPVNSYFVLIAFIFLFIVFILQVARLRTSRSGFFGFPSIEKIYFYSGKIAIFPTWFLFIMKAIHPRLGYIYLPVGLSWFAVIVLYVGVIIFTISLINLGKSLAIGLPDHVTKLQTHGLYRFSRNPLYLGVHLIAVASCIYFPDVINVSFALYGIYIHHQIIRQEEDFLSKRFGRDWVTYKERVRRYI